MTTIYAEHMLQRTAIKGMVLVLDHPVHKMLSCRREAARAS